jgi:FixJ family two-component response regulator
MPIKDGMQLIAEARGLGDRRPFIFFTAFTTQEMLESLSSQGVVSFVEKGQLEGLEVAVMKGLGLLTKSQSETLITP